MQAQPYPSTDVEPAPDDILRLPAVRRTTSLGRSTIYRLIALKMFPGQVRLGPRAVGWRRSDVDFWKASRPKAH
ncbi:AlpA family phage regulatory protein [Paucibacter sp. R3-3]|uniref:AlpA family phage regulatory protein n=1 Tax=Roseateles agri TaxID=3098619 RepID=A0ABU5DT65_9BURK|nr:AlpA family phage regulatory protein [Paucibacter sp. R3-3]MDY0749103.1 AlpA family phage regulatory protein [Paucibacter sp. R3-3]